MQYRVRSSRPVLCLCVLTNLVAGCAEEREASSISSSVVYGVDDREDVYAHPDANLRALAQSSIVALMLDTTLDMSDPTNVRYVGTDTLASTADLCAGERFANDPTHAFCSGTLVGDDLVLTAGHCFTQPGANDPEPSTCANTRFVFNYVFEAEGQLAAITRDDVFSCSEIVASALLDNEDGTSLDYAFVRLDRSAAPRFTPVAIQLDASSLHVGQPLVVIGFGSRLPAKIDSGGFITDLRSTTADFYRANFDTFGGNSGSGVFDATSRSMIGILVRGSTDYIVRPGETCQRANVCPMEPSSDEACNGEDVNYLPTPFSEFCARAPNDSLCTDANSPDGGATITSGVSGGAGCNVAGRQNVAGIVPLAGVAMMLFLRRCGVRARNTKRA